MTDNRIEKIRAEIERLKHQSVIDSDRQAERGLQSASMASFGKVKACEELLSFIDSMQKEPKECMYSKDNYTDEDKKVLCDGCEEECKFNKKQEPASEVLETEIEKVRKHHFINDDFDKAELDGRTISNIAHHFANWQKKQMMANAVNGFVIEDIEEGNGDFLLSAEYLSKDMGFKDRQKVKVIVIKED